MMKCLAAVYMLGGERSYRWRIGRQSKGWWDRHRWVTEESQRFCHWINSNCALCLPSRLFDLATMSLIRGTWLWAAWTGRNCYL